MHHYTYITFRYSGDWQIFRINLDELHHYISNEISDMLQGKLIQQSILYDRIYVANDTKNEFLKSDV